MKAYVHFISIMFTHAFFLSIHMLVELDGKEDVSRFAHVAHDMVVIVWGYCLCAVSKWVDSH